MGRVVNVCISEKKGTQKHPIDEGEFIVEFGLKDDAHAGKWHRQVSLLSFEKVEALRYLKYLKEGGTIVANNYKMESVATITGKAEYKVEEVDKKLKELNAKVINAADKAVELGNEKVMNIILLGTVIKGMHLEEIDWEQIIRDNVKEKFIDINIRALHEGMELVS